MLNLILLKKVQKSSANSLGLFYQKNSLDKQFRKLDINQVFVYHLKKLKI